MVKWKHLVLVLSISILASCIRPHEDKNFTFDLGQIDNYSFSVKPRPTGLTSGWITFNVEMPF